MEYEAKRFNSIIYAQILCVRSESCRYKISRLECEVETLEGLPCNQVPSLFVDASNGRASSIAGYL
jgi:hypothetical protein